MELGRGTGVLRGFFVEGAAVLLELGNGTGVFLGFFVVGVDLPTVGKGTGVFRELLMVGIASYTDRGHHEALSRTFLAEPGFCRDKSHRLYHAISLRATLAKMVNFLYL